MTKRSPRRFYYVEYPNNRMIGPFPTREKAQENALYRSARIKEIIGLEPKENR